MNKKPVFLGLLGIWLSLIATESCFYRSFEKYNEYTLGIALCQSGKINQNLEKAIVELEQGIALGWCGKEEQTLLEQKHRELAEQNEKFRLEKIDIELKAARDYLNKGNAIKDHLKALPEYTSAQEAIGRAKSAGAKEEVLKPLVDELLKNRARSDKAAEQERIKRDKAAERERLEKEKAAEKAARRRAYSPLRCGDGSLSPSCICGQNSWRGCCSWHGGVAGCSAD